MSNFLKNLATRSLDDSAAIQPRVPTLFEPLPQAESATTIEANSEIAVAPTMRNAAAAAVVPRTVATRSNPGSQALLPFDQDQDGAGPTLPPITSRAQTPELPRSQKHPPLVKPSDAPRADPAIALAAPSAAIRESSGESDFEPNLGTLAALALPTDIEALPTAAHVEPQTPSFSVDQRKAGTMPEPAAGPIIQVRIGRIDVRAVVTPEQPRAARATAKPSLTLSLEDYLKNRNAGAR